MPRYHFNLDDGLGHVPDKEGQELADEEAARAEAVRSARSMIAADVMEGWLDLGGRIEVTDAAGTKLFTIEFEDAVELRQLSAR